MGNTVAVLMRKAPYGSVYTAEGFRSMMGIGVFEMDIDVVFVDDGVYALVKGQNPAGRGLTADDLVMDVGILDDAGVARVLESSGIVLPF